MGVIIRLSRFVAVLVILLTLVSAAQRVDASTAESSRRCLGSESAIRDNLPLGTTSRSTEITAIRGILAGAPQRTVGWLYTTRNGSQFVQSQSPDALAHLLLRAGDRRLAEGVKAGRPTAYFPITSGTGAALRHLASHGVVFATCFGTGA